MKFWQLVMEIFISDRPISCSDRHWHSLIIFKRNNPKNYRCEKRYLYHKSHLQIENQLKKICNICGGKKCKKKYYYTTQSHLYINIHST